MVKTAFSKEAPKRLLQSEGKIHFTFNAHPSGEQYEYNYVIIDPPATEEKIIAALRQTETPICEETANQVDDQYQAINTRLDEIGQMTWEQVDAHINSVFGSLSAAQKSSLQKLYKCVLALVKIR